MVEQMEKKLGRKLTPAEKKKLEELMHHNEYFPHSHEEEPIAC